MTYPNANLTQITATTACTVGWVNAFNANLRLMLQDVVRARGTVTNFKSMTRAILTSTGQAKTGAIRHNQLGDITPDQHHNKYHAKTHTDGSDDIPFASASRRGLVTATTAQQIASLSVTGSTRNWFVMTTYTGNAGTSKFVTLGFRPSYCQLFYAHAASTSYPDVRWLIDCMDGANYNFKHKDRNALGSFYHAKVTKANTINIVTNGVKVFASCNINTQYVIMGWRCDPYIVTNYSS